MCSVYRAADGEDVVEDGLDGRRVERDDLRLWGEGGGELLDGFQVDRADVAEVLCDDEVWAEVGDGLEVEFVEGWLG